jgi:hypothetical protein
MVLYTTYEVSLLRSKSLWRWYLSTNIIFLDIIHRPAYISKHNVSETGFCLRFQVKPTQLGPIDRASPYLWTEIHKNGTMDNVQKHNICTNDESCCGRIFGVWYIWTVIVHIKS